MRMGEFVRKEYPIRETVRAIIETPERRVMAQDDLPYDDIIFHEGEYRKVVYVKGDEPIAVRELLLFLPEEVAKMEDGDFKTLYNNYMQLVEVRKIDFSTSLDLSSEYRDKAKIKEDLLRKCMH